MAGLAPQRLLHAVGSDRAAAHPGETECDLGHLVAGHSHLRRHRHDRPVLRPPAELEVSASAARGWRRDADFSQDLIGFERRREGVDKEIPCCDRPLPARTDRLEFGVEGEQAGREVPERVRVRGRAADRAPVANLRVADL